MTHTVEHIMSAANPVVVDPADSQGPQADSALREILSGRDGVGAPGSPRGRRRLPYLVAATAAALIAAVTVQLIPSATDPVYAVTPPVLTTQRAASSDGVPDELRALADKVADLPSDIGTGPVARVSMQSWSLFTRVDGQQVTSQIVPQDTMYETRPDGTTSLTTSFTYDGDSYDETSTGQNSLPYGVRELSSDPAELARQLAIGQPASNGTRGLFDSIVQANRQVPIKPAVRAATLRLLADADGIETVGSVTDRLGRPGTGFTVDSANSGLPTQYMLIIDSNDGKLLGYEEMLTSDPGKLNVRTPAVIQYIAFEEARFVN